MTGFNAPLILCIDGCDHGRVTCPECDGVGHTERAVGFRVAFFGCDTCRGAKTVDCDTCEGQGEYPDPEAILHCDGCGGELTLSGGCPDTCEQLKEVAL